MRALPEQPTLHPDNFAVNCGGPGESRAGYPSVTLELFRLLLRREPHQVLMPNPAPPSRRKPSIHLSTKCGGIKVAEEHEAVEISSPEADNLPRRADAEPRQRTTVQHKFDSRNVVGFLVNPDLALRTGRADVVCAPATLIFQLGSLLGDGENAIRKDGLVVAQVERKLDLGDLHTLDVADQLPDCGEHFGSTERLAIGEEGQAGKRYAREAADLSVPEKKTITSAGEPSPNMA